MPMSRLACTSLFRHSACTVFPTGVRLSRRPVERWDAVAIANEGPVLARECFTDHVNATSMFDDIDVWCTSLGQQDYLDATPPRQLVHDLAALSPVCFHIRDEIRHGISDTPQSIPTALPRVDPQSRLQNRLSCECFTYSGHLQGILMQFVPSWRPKISQKSP